MPLFGFCFSTGILSFCLSPHTRTHIHPRHFTTPSTEINKSIAFSTFEGKIDESYDWLDFQLEIFFQKLVRDAFIAYWHVEAAFSPLFTTPDTPRSVNFFLDFHNKKAWPEFPTATTKRTTTKLLNRALYKTNFISSDYPGRYRFVLCLNKWKSINVVYGLLLRTSFPILSAANILFC